MSTVRRYILVVLGALSVLLSGCAVTAAPPTDSALAVVVGAHANAPAPAPLGPTIAVIEHAVRAQATAAIIVNSGSPTVARKGRLGLDCNNEATCAQAVEAKKRLVLGTLSAVRAEQPENNLLGGLQLGARTLVDHHGPTTLVVLDSGLQTTAPLRFQDPGLLAADPRQVADYLDHTHQLPSLSAATTVVFSGLGDTAPPQAPLSAGERANLKAIWEEIVRRAGAGSVQTVEAPLTGPALVGVPPVTLVPVRPPPVFTAAAADLSDAVLPFLPDTAVLRDPAAARTVLVDLSARITSTHARVVLTGATADVGPLDGQRALGAARADAVRDVLVGLGVPAELITTRGVGSAWPGYVVDHDAGGELLPGPAAQNRRVLVQFAAGTI